MSPPFTSSHWARRTHTVSTGIKVLIKLDNFFLMLKCFRCSLNADFMWTHPVFPSFFVLLSVHFPLSLLSPESVSRWERDTVCPTFQRHHELELPHAAAGGDPQPLHLRGEAVAHCAHRLPHCSHCCWGRVHLLWRTEQVCLQLGPAGLWECLLRCLCSSFSRSFLGFPNYPGGNALSHVHGLRCKQDRTVRWSKRWRWDCCSQNRRRGLHAPEAQENVFWGTTTPGNRGGRGWPGGRSHDLWGSRDRAAKKTKRSSAAHTQAQNSTWWA